MKENRTDALFHQCFDLMVDKKDIDLVKLNTKKDVTQKDLDDFLAAWDIEAVGGDRSLLLSYFMKNHPELKYPDEIAPRLKGLYNYHRFNNLRLSAACSTMCKRLVSRGITPIILKGGLMKALRPEYPRVMGDMDLLVPEERFDDVIHIVRDEGYEFYDAGHSIDLHEKGSKEGLLDIHRYLNIGNRTEAGRISKEVFRRALPYKVFGVDMLIPSAEDCYFSIVLNISNCFAGGQSLHAIPYALLDMDFILKNSPDFNWDIVYENVRQTDSQKMFVLAARIIKVIEPAFFPQKLYERVIAEGGASSDDESLWLFYRAWLNYSYLRKALEQGIKVRWSKEYISSVKNIKTLIKCKAPYYFMKIPLYLHSVSLAELWMKLFFKPQPEES